MADVDRPSLVDGGLVAADPATLIPYEDATPLVTSTWHDGVVSADGRWVAVVSGLELESTNQINLIDAESGTVVATTKGTGDGMAVGADGLAVWFDDGTLAGLTTDGRSREWGQARPTNPALHDTLTVFGDGRIVYLAGSAEELEPVNVVMINDGDVEEIELAILSGTAPPPIDPAMPSRDLIAPDVAWDETQNRAILVSGTGNEIFELDLDTGEVASHTFEHPYDPDPNGQGVGRDIHISRDGNAILIATRILDVEGTVDDWEARDHASDIVIVDSDDWSSQSVSQSVWTLVSSPSNDEVAGLGASITWDDDGNTETLQSPVYLFDALTGQPLVGFEGRSGTITDAGFAADGAYLYVTSHEDGVANVDIIDVTTQELVGSLGFTGISFIEEAGLIAFHSQPR